MKQQGNLLIPEFQDMLDAHQRIDTLYPPHACANIKFFERTNGRTAVFFKCENFQKAGAFKVRGACNAVFGLDDEKAKIGVATHSSGNHALSLSYAAGRRGIPCTVVMPHSAPQAKKRRSAWLWWRDCRMRAFHIITRGYFCQSGSGNGRRFCASL